MGMAEAKKPIHIKIEYVRKEPVKVPVKVNGLTEEDMRQIEKLLRDGK